MQQYCIVSEQLANTLKKASTLKSDGAVQQEHLGHEITNNSRCDLQIRITEIILWVRLIAFYLDTGPKFQQMTMILLPHKDKLPNSLDLAEY